MYKEKHTKKGLLTHSEECKGTFGKRDNNCPRCIELLNGAATRTYTQRPEMKDYKKHSCKESGCLDVCTYNDY